MTTFTFVDETDVLSTTTSTSLFSRALIDTWCLGQMELINVDVLHSKICKLLRGFDLSQFSNYDEVESLVTRIQSLLMIVRPEFTTLSINVNTYPYKYPGGMRASINSMSDELTTLVTKFLSKKRQRRIIEVIGDS